MCFSFFQPKLNDLNYISDHEFLVWNTNFVKSNCPCTTRCELVLFHTESDLVMQVLLDFQDRMVQCICPSSLLLHHTWKNFKILTEVLRAHASWVEISIFHCTGNNNYHVYTMVHLYQTIVDTTELTIIHVWGIYTIQSFNLHGLYITIQTIIVRWYFDLSK